MTITWNINKKTLITNIAIPLAVGGISALITGGGFKDYSNVARPALSPPAILFPIVWTLLYILMGISAYIVWERDTTKARLPVAIYAVQLFLNFMWPIFFFSFKAYLFSFIWLLLLWTFVIAMIIVFYKVNRLAGILQIPYLLWLTFAAYLNLGVFVLN